MGSITGITFSNSLVSPTTLPALTATAIWQDLTASSDFTVSGSIGALLVSNTIAAMVTAMWQDLLSSGDFGTAGSVGALMKAITNLQYTVQSIGRGTVGSGATTTSVPTSAFSPAGAVAGQFIGRVILFDWDTTTAALQGQVGVITASSNASTPTFTVTGGGASTTLTTAPASGDSFSVI